MIRIRFSLVCGRSELHSFLERLDFRLLFFQIPLLAESLIWANGSALVPRMIRSSAYNKAAFTDEDFEQFRTTFRKPYSARAAINYYRALMRRDLMRTPPPDHWLARRG